LSYLLQKCNSFWKTQFLHFWENLDYFLPPSNLWWFILYFFSLLLSSLQLFILTCVWVFLFYFHFLFSLSMIIYEFSTVIISFVQNYSWFLLEVCDLQMLFLAQLSRVYKLPGIVEDQSLFWHSTTTPLYL